MPLALQSVFERMTILFFIVQHECHCALLPRERRRTLHRYARQDTCRHLRKAPDGRQHEARV